MAERMASAIGEAVREHCKGRLEMDWGSELAAEVGRRVLRCSDFVLLAQHQKIPRIKAKRIVAAEMPDKPLAPSLGNEDFGGEPIYE
jgi:hypothetical protein